MGCTEFGDVQLKLSLGEPAELERVSCTASRRASARSRARATIENAPKLEFKGRDCSCLAAKMLLDSLIVGEAGSARLSPCLLSRFFEERASRTDRTALDSPVSTCKGTLERSFRCPA